MSKDKKLQIKSSAAEFLIFECQKQGKGVEVRFEDGDLWLTQKSIADLFNTSKQDISYHLGKVFSELELDENSVVKKYLTTADDGKNYNTNYYNIDAVISVGYRVNSDRAIQFRRWATNVLKEFAKKDHMGLTSWKNSPNGKILETDVVIAKNYLSKEELEQLELIVTAFLNLAEARAKQNIAMTMEDWAMRIDKYLLSDDRDVLKDAGKISHEIACDKALSEFEKYRVKQDKLYKSDFDKLLEESDGGN